MWNVSASTVDYPEASDWFRSRVPLLKADWLLLGKQAREQSFTIAGVSQLTVIQDVLKALEDAVDRGDSFEDFKAKVGTKLAREWGGSNPTRLKLIFEQGLQNAYNAGRYTTMNHPDMRLTRPFWLFDAVLDTLTTKLCRACDGTLLEASNSWWNTHYPPLHFRCRSSVRSLTERQARKKGITTEPTNLQAEEGFDMLPSVRAYLPDPEDFLPEKRAQAQAVTKAPPPSADEIEQQIRQVATDYTKEIDELFSESERLVSAGKIAEAAKFAVDAGEKKREMISGMHQLMFAETPGTYTLDEQNKVAKKRRKMYDQALTLLGKIVGEIDDLDSTTVPLYEKSARRSYFSSKPPPGYRAPAPYGLHMSRHIKTEQDATGTIFHEMGHFIEDSSPTIAKKVHDFYDERTKNDSIEPLSNYNLAYGPNERTRKDKWIRPYIGKVYETRDGTKYATEILSVWLELIYINPLDVIEADKEFFDFGWNLIRGIDQ